MKVGDVMSSQVVTVVAGTPFRELARSMSVAAVSALPVVEADGSVLGVVTAGDLLVKLAVPGRHRAVTAFVDLYLAGGGDWLRKSEGLVAADLMTSPALTASVDDTLQATARRMLGARIRSMPVIGGDHHLAGIVSRVDLLRVFDRADAEIAGDMAKLVGDHSRFGAGWVVDVHGGTVLFTGGTCRTPERKALAAAARAVPGVVDVVVRPGAGGGAAGRSWKGPRPGGTPPPRP